jgi:NAD(P)-dependent dehydrogenase (short-subunit alcohol dehydrogenase family)
MADVLAGSKGRSVSRGRVEGKITFVTGAGSGIGREICVVLAEEGADVVVTSRSSDHVEGTCDLVEQAVGARPLGFVLDVRDEQAVKDGIARIGREKERIDVVSCNAGIELPDAPTVARSTTAEFDEVQRVNMTGTYLVNREALSLMSQGGSIINMASIASFVGFAGDAPYAASKGATLMFTRALAVEIADKGIRVNCVCPGMIDTPLTHEYAIRAPDPQAALAEYAAVAPMNRLGSPREIANCVLFLASDESSFITGSALVADGGATAAG